MDSIRSFFANIGTSSGGQVPPKLYELARRALADHRVADDPEAFRDVVQSLVARAIGDVQTGHEHAWRELGTMHDRSLWNALRQRLRQTAAEQDPLHNERHALAQHVKRALSESANEDSSRPGKITDGHGRFSYDLVKTAVAWVMASAWPPERTARAVTNRLVGEYLRAYKPSRHKPSDDDEEEEEKVAPGSDDPADLVRRKIDGPRMAQELVTRLTPEKARVISMLIGGSTYQQISESEGIPIGTLHRWVRAAEAVITKYVENVSIRLQTLRYVFKVIGSPKEYGIDRLVRQEVRDRLEQELETRSSKPGGKSRPDLPSNRSR